jgi:hypothetical protein
VLSHGKFGQEAFLAGAVRLEWHLRLLRPVSGRLSVLVNAHCPVYVSLKSLHDDGIVEHRPAAIPRPTVPPAIWLVPGVSSRIFAASIGRAGRYEVVLLIEAMEDAWPSGTTLRLSWCLVPIISETNNKAGKPQSQTTGSWRPFVL